MINLAVWSSSLEMTAMISKVNNTYQADYEFLNKTVPLNLRFPHPSTSMIFLKQMHCITPAAVPIIKKFPRY